MLINRIQGQGNEWLLLVPEYSIHLSTRMFGLKLEGNGSFLGMEGGKRSTSIWLFERVYPCMGVFLEGLPLYGCVFRGFTPVWVCF